MAWWSIPFVCFDDIYLPFNSTLDFQYRFNRMVFYPFGFCLEEAVGFSPEPWGTAWRGHEEALRCYVYKDLQQISDWLSIRPSWLVTRGGTDSSPVLFLLPKTLQDSIMKAVEEEWFARWNAKPESMSNRGGRSCGTWKEWHWWRIYRMIVW